LAGFNKNKVAFDSRTREGARMAVILVYIALVVVGQSITISIASAVETFAPAASLMVFFALFALTFVVMWYAAVWVAERFLGRFLNYGPDGAPGTTR
jgi:hypothetical protein